MKSCGYTNTYVLVTIPSYYCSLQNTHGLFKVKVKPNGQGVNGATGHEMGLVTFHHSLSIATGENRKVATHTVHFKEHLESNFTAHSIS